MHYTYCRTKDIKEREKKRKFKPKINLFEQKKFNINY